MIDFKIEVLGRRFSELVKYHQGHQNIPLTAGEIERNFTSFTGDLLTPNQRKQVLSLVWNLEQVDDVGEIMSIFVRS